MYSSTVPDANRHDGEQARAVGQFKLVQHRHLIIRSSFGRARASAYAAVSGDADAWADAPTREPYTGSRISLPLTMCERSKYTRVGARAHSAMRSCVFACRCTDALSSFSTICLSQLPAPTLRQQGSAFLHCFLTWQPSGQVLYRFCASRRGVHMCRGSHALAPVSSPVLWPARGKQG
jgi:hypothetical protein